MIYPLVMTHIAMANHHLEWIFPIKMVFFHSYVKLQGGSFHPIPSQTISLQIRALFVRVVARSPSTSGSTSSSRQGTQHQDLPVQLVVQFFQWEGSQKNAKMDQNRLCSFSRNMDSQNPSCFKNLSWSKFEDHFRAA